MDLSGMKTVAGSCERGKEISGFIKCEDSLTG